MDENKQKEKEILENLSPEQRSAVLKMVANIEAQQALMKKKQAKKLPVSKHKSNLRAKAKRAKKSRRKNR